MKTEINFMKIKCVNEVLINQASNIWLSNALDILLVYRTISIINIFCPVE